MEGLEKGHMLRALFLLRTRLFIAAYNPNASSATAWVGECSRFGPAGVIEVGKIHLMLAS